MQKNLEAAGQFYPWYLVHASHSIENLSSALFVIAVLATFAVAAAAAVVVVAYEKKQRFAAGFAFDYMDRRIAFRNFVPDGPCSLLMNCNIVVPQLEKSQRMVPDSF